MPSRTGIEWCSYSSNPLKLKLRKSGKLVDACVLRSEGCRFCYALGITRRFWPKEEGPFPGYTAKLLKMGDPVLCEDELRHMLTFQPRPPYNSGQDRPRVFVGDMTDMFGDWVPFELLDRLFAIFALRPDVDWQLLTKRPERMAQYLTADPAKRCDNVSWAISGIVKEHGDPQDARNAYQRRHYPEVVYPLLPNVWLGTSVEDQERADERIPQLLKCPAAVRFLSCEPLLGAVAIFGPCKYHAPVKEGDLPVDCSECDGFGNSPLMTLGDRLHWVIVGGESGPGARACRVDWVRSLVAQCKASEVACFVKQLGAHVIIPDYEEGQDAGPARLLLRDSHGGDMEEWRGELADLKVREFPSPKATVARA